MYKKYTSLNLMLSLILSLFILSASIDAYPTENFVLKLNEDNLGYAMHEFKYLTVLFYSASDPNCKSVIPEFESAAQILKKENFVLGKINADESSEIIRYFRVEAIPSIAIIRRGSPLFYEGEKKKIDIAGWVLDKTMREFNEIHNEKELEEFIKQYDLSMIYYGKDKNVLREMILAERKIDDIPMGRITDDNMIKSHAEKGHEDKKEYLILNTETELKKYYLYDIKADKIIEFYNLYSTPKVIEFSAQTSSVLFSKRQNSLMIFSSRSKSQFNEMKDLLGKLWPKVNKKLKLFVSDLNEGMSVRLSEYCGAKEKDIPIAYILEPVSENPIKYRLEGEITEESLLKFVEDWENGKLKVYMRSEPEIKDNDGEVFNLVGKTYKRDVIDNDKDVVIYFYAPWCEKCQSFYPKYERLARKLRKRNKNLLFAKMDATENDIEYFAVNKYPTIKFYPGNKKDVAPIHIGNKLGIVEMLDIIKENAFHKVNDENYDRKREIELENKEREEEDLLNSEL